MTPGLAGPMVDATIRVASFWTSQTLSNLVAPGDIPVIKTLSAAFALAIALSLLAPVLVTNQPAQAGCERVYTSSGWQTRCS
jgi:hypothetical protein